MPSVTPSNMSFGSNEVFSVRCLVKVLVVFRYGKKHFVKVVTSLVTVLLKMTLLCLYFVFTKKTLFQAYLKLVH